jgi:hypothetical protein
MLGVVTALSENRIFDKALITLQIQQKPYFDTRTRAIA